MIHEVTGDDDAVGSGIERLDVGQRLVATLGGTAGEDSRGEVGVGQVRQQHHSSDVRGVRNLQMPCRGP